MPSPSALLAVLAVVGSAVVVTTLAAEPPTMPVVAGAARAGVEDADGGPSVRRPRPVWAWPLSPRPRVLREFVAPRSAYGPGHRGVDLGGSVGAAVRAVDHGVVLHAGQVAGRGTVTVRHGSGLESTYEPLDVQVARGDRVATGDPLGALSGSSGVVGHCGPAVCLHLGARRGDGYLDPLPLLTGGRVVLLPLSGVATGPTSLTTGGRPAPEGRRARPAGGERGGRGRRGDSDDVCPASAVGVRRARWDASRWVQPSAVQVTLARATSARTTATTRQVPVRARLRRSSARDAAGARPPSPAVGDGAETGADRPRAEVCPPPRPVRPRPRPECRSARVPSSS
ncbi:MAG: murein hydrolase activator EnvC family protein [Phycicoccus sp.]